MRIERIIRAWKDSSFRETLSPEQRESLPENPAGTVELSDVELGQAVGGGSFFVAADSGQFCTTPCTTSLACPNNCGGGGITPIRPPKY